MEIKTNTEHTADTGVKPTDRKELRDHYKNIRDAIPSHVADSLSGRICSHILSWETYKRSDRFLFYYPLGKEVSLLPVAMDVLASGRQAAFPKVRAGTMDFYEVHSLDGFTEGAFHVMEPQASFGPVDWKDALCFIPGVVFDRTGGRFGYGKGYYDRYFTERHSRILVGCAYACQIAPECLPTQRWDQKMDHLACEEGIFRCL